MNVLKKIWFRIIRSVKESIKESESNSMEKIPNPFDSKSIPKLIPFILFMSVLGMIYIYNSHRVDKKARLQEKIIRENKELRSEYITLKSELNSKSRQSEVIELLKRGGTDLEELKEPPVKVMAKR